MAEPDFDIERIRTVLRDATAATAHFSQRSLSAEAGESRDAVGDIINGRNKNPTTKVLSNLARALGGDLSMFGLADERATDALRLPSGDRLAAMMSALLRGVGLEAEAELHSETLARRLPVALEQAGAKLASSRSARSTKAALRPRPPATPDRG
jgi:transcriptional regulator with XRE-family HTH domain